MTSETRLAKIVPYIEVEDKSGDTIRLFSVDVAVKYNVDLSSNRNIDRIARWMLDKERAFRAVLQHAQLEEKWDAHRQNDKQKDLDRRRDLRQQAIEKRLRDLGWVDEIAKLPSGALAAQKSVRTVAPLSEKGWLAIQDALIAFMQKARDVRLAKEKSSALEARRKLLSDIYCEYRLTKPFGTILPGIGDLKNAPVIVRLFQETPFDKQISASTVLAALDTIPQSFLDEWQMQCDSKLVSIAQDQLSKSETLPNALGIDNFTADSLRLASVLFSVDGVGYSHYPRVLISPYPYYFYIAWQAGIIRLHLDAVTLARRAVELVGKDPLTATVEDMDRLEPWYYYQAACGSVAVSRASDATRIVYPWRYVILQQTHHQPKQLALLGPEDTAIAREFLQSELYDVEFTNADAQCLHCAERFTASSDMREHMREVKDDETGLQPGHIRADAQTGHAGCRGWRNAGFVGPSQCTAYGVLVRAVLQASLTAPI